MRFLWDIVRLLVVSSALIGADGAPFSSTDGATLEKRYTASNVGTCSGGMWSVAEANASFNSHFSTDFTTASVIGQDLGISVNTIGAGTYSPYARQFKQANTILTSGVGLKMVVPGGQAGNAPDPNTGDPTITSSQVTTNYDDVLYASVRTVAMLSDVAGTVAGFFFYSNDSQEADIEIRSFLPTQVWYTNQRTWVVGSGNAWSPVALSYNYTGPTDMTTAFHEYRYDWTAAGVSYYIDGVLMTTITTNVPSIPGYLMWNNWSNGDAWTAGPPVDTNTIIIKSIDAYFNRTSITTTSACSSSTSSSVTVSSTSTSTKSSSSTTTTKATTSSTSTSTSTTPTTTSTSTSTKPTTTSTSTSTTPSTTSTSTSTKPTTTSTSTTPTSTSTTSTSSTSTSSTTTTSKPITTSTSTSTTPTPTPTSTSTSTTSSTPTPTPTTSSSSIKTSSTSTSTSTTSSSTTSSSISLIPTSLSSPFQVLGMIMQHINSHLVDPS